MDNIEKMAEALLMLHTKSGGDSTNGITSVALRNSLRDEKEIPSKDVNNLYTELENLKLVDIVGGQVYLMVDLGDWPSYPPEQQAAIMASWMGGSGFASTAAAEPSYIPPPAPPADSYHDEDEGGYHDRAPGGAIETDEHEMVSVAEVDVPETDSIVETDEHDILSAPDASLSSNEDDPGQTRHWAVTLPPSTSESEAIRVSDESLTLEIPLAETLPPYDDSPALATQELPHRSDIDEPAPYQGQAQDEVFSADERQDEVFNADERQDEVFSADERQADTAQANQESGDVTAGGEQAENILDTAADSGQEQAADDAQPAESPAKTGYGSSGGYGYGNPSPDALNQPPKEIATSQPRPGVRVMNVDMSNVEPPIEEQIKELKDGGIEKKSPPPAGQSSGYTSIAPTQSRRLDEPVMQPKPAMTAPMPSSTHSEPQAPAQSTTSAQPTAKPGGYGGNPPASTQKTSGGYGSDAPSQSPANKQGGYGSGSGGKSPVADERSAAKSNPPTWGAVGGQPAPKPNDSDRQLGDGPKLPHLITSTKSTGEWGRQNNPASVGGTSNTHVIELALLEAYDDQQVDVIADKTRRIRDDIRASQGDVTIRLELTVYHSANNADTLQARLEDFSRRSGFNAKDTMNTLNLRFKLQL